MNTSRLFFYFIASLLLVATACAPPSTPTLTEAPVIGAPASEIPATVPATTDPSSTQAPALNLAGPEVGTSMVWVDGSLLVFVPHTEFEMGAGGTDNPVHTVGLSDFWIYRTKVTNRMYALCVAAGKCTLPQADKAVKAFAKPAQRDLPVAGVDWSQADTYCKWVNGHLPTEAQWELVARGPQSSLYPWGSSKPACDLLNFNNCLGGISRVYDFPGGKSYFDALDMAGNAYEWAGDWYDANYYFTSPAGDPPGPDSGRNRVVRGSSFEDDATYVPSARRFFYDPDRFREDLGFRCVVDHPTQYAPFCQAVFVPGAPGQYPDGASQPGQGYCPPLNASQSGEGCESGVGQGTLDVTGDTIASANGSAGLSCSLINGNTGVFCSGAQGSSGTVNVCASGQSCQPAPAPDPGCPPGTYYDAAAKQCVGQGAPGQCPSGYSYDSAKQCCAAGPGLPYPGCAPDEYYDPLLGCLSGSAPQAGCRNFSINLGTCAPPPGGSCDPQTEPNCPGGQPDQPGGQDCRPNPNCGQYPTGGCPLPPVCY